MFKNLLCCCLLFTTVQHAISQTVPAAQSIPYSQDFSSLVATSAVYPAGWQGWQLNATGPTTFFRTTAPTSNLNLTASSTAATTAGGVHNYNGKIGILASGTNDPALGLVVNTVGKINIVVTFDIATIRNLYNGSTETRRNNVELQYRVGNTNGTFTSLTGSIYINNTSAQTTGTTSRNGMRFQYILPAACENQSDVQLRWVQRDSSGAGSRPSFAIDNVIVCPAPIVAATVIPACNENDGSISLSVSAGLPPYTVAWDTINKNGPVFSVTAATKNASHPYFGVGFPVGYVLDGIQGKELNLTRGVNYTFAGTFPGHPFHITTSAAGGSFLNEVTTGITNSQLQGGAMVFTPNVSHPALLYYMCGVHLNMGWKANINNGQLTGLNISNLSPGKYSAAVSSSDGCITTLTITVSEGISPEPHPNSNSPICEGETLELIANEGDIFNWSGPAGFISAVSEPQLSNVSIVNAGCYTVVATSGEGCTATDSVEVIIHLSPSISSFLPASGPIGTTVTLSGNNFSVVDAVKISGQTAIPVILNNTSLEFNIPAGAVSDNIIVNTADNCSDTSAVAFLVVNISQLNLKLFVEGYYTGSNQMSTPLQDPLHPTHADSLIVALYDSTNLAGGPAFSVAGVVDVSGNVLLSFPPAVIGNRYYIVIRHRNSIETWSKHTQLFSQTTLFDFTE
ncbi:MAG: IPT/TIG domain-containing protein [Bacteroidetes bacterium]|nr:IPT/TIG domain-containing protein [Bacteroidota bacterium]